MTRSPRSKSTKGIRKTAALTRAAVPDDAEISVLASDLAKMIDAARQNVAQAANAALTTLYWQLGHRVHTTILEGRRGEYGARIVAAVGRQLEAQHGRGFGEKNLRMQLHEVRPDRVVRVGGINRGSPMVDR